MNIAIRASRYPTIVRVDAHSELEPGYTRRALQTLTRVGAANVGGVMRADGRTPFQRAVARAYNSRIGLGGGAYHGGADEGDAESAYLVHLPVLAYVALVVVVAAGPGGGAGWRDKLWTLAVLPTMHFSWGTGFLIGLIRGADDTVDTSRIGDRNTPLP